MDDIPSQQDSLKTKLNHETAKISWQDLERFYASGAVVVVAKGLDLIDVAVQFSQDNKGVVEQWLSDGSVEIVSDAKASQWSAQSATLWAVVVAPWVLVQEL